MSPQVGVWLHNVQLTYIDMHYLQLTCTDKNIIIVQINISYLYTQEMTFLVS